MCLLPPLLILGIFYAVRLRVLLPLTAAHFDGVDVDAFDEWKRLERSSIIHLLWSTWGVLLVQLVIGLVVIVAFQNRGGQVLLRLVVIGGLVMFLIGLIASVVEGTRASKYKKAMGLQWSAFDAPRVVHRQSLSPTAQPAAVASQASRTTPATASGGILLYQTGAQSGPHSLANIREMRRMRQIAQDALYWRHGMAAWAPVGGLLQPSPTLPSAPAPPSGKIPVSRAEEWTQKDEKSLLKFKCPKCGAGLRAPTDGINKKAKCNKCHEVFWVRDQVSLDRIPGVGQSPSSSFNSDSIVAETIARINQGGKAGIDCYDDKARFENRVKYHLFRVSEGAFPRVTLIALNRCKSSGFSPHIIVESGPYDEFIQFHKDEGGNQRLRRCFPGKDWDYLGSIGEYLNFSLPGYSLASVDPFTKLLNEVASGFYSIHRVISVDGERRGTKVVAATEQPITKPQPSARMAAASVSQRSHKADNQQVISQLASLESKIRQYLPICGLAGPDGDVHPGICANIRESIEALQTGRVAPTRVASGLKKMADYVEQIGLTKDPMLKTYMFDLKMIADQIRE